jgi:hypothetical protein
MYVSNRRQVMTQVGEAGDNASFKQKAGMPDRRQAKFQIRARQWHR